MDWFIIGLASAMLFGGVMVVDKRMLDRHFPSVSSFIFVAGVVQIVIGLVALAVAVPLLGLADVDGLVIGFWSGVVWALGLTFFFYGLRLEEVSRATPIYGTNPLFASLLAVVFLGERLSGLQVGAVAAIVIGAGLASYRPTPGRRGFISPRALAILLVGSALTGIAFVVNKEATTLSSFWLVFGGRSLGLGVGMAAFAYRRSLFANVAAALSNPTARRLYFGGEIVMASAAVTLLQLAITLGPISLVSALNSTRSLFVLAITLGLSTRFWNVLDEPMDRNTVTLKLASTALIVAGVIGLVL
jgi:transporter family protein